jgi:hypothetical protein
LKTTQPTDSDLNDLLKDYREIFHQSRYIDSLEEHWVVLKELRLLIDQKAETTIDDIHESFENKEYIKILFHL